MKTPVADSHALLNCLRGFLALSIIWHHLQAVPVTLLGSGDLYFLISVPGRIIVWIFFIISGYSIYYGYMNGKYHLSVRDVLRFYFNRGIRILPLFYLTTLLSLYLLMKGPSQDFPTWHSIARTLFFLDINLYHGINAITPGWFVGVIVHFYLLAPILVAGYARLHRKAGWIWMFFILLFISVLSHRLGRLSAGTYDIRSIIGSLPLFLWGFYAFELCFSKSSKPPLLFLKTDVPKWLSTLCLVVFFEIIFYFYAFDRGYFWKKPFEFYVGIGGVLLIFLVIRSGHHESVIQNPVVRMLGDWALGFLNLMGRQAYGLYLWHGIVIILLSRDYLLGFGGPPFASFKLKVGYFLLTAAISYIASIVFFHILEKPFHRFYKNKHEGASVPRWT